MYLIEFTKEAHQALARMPANMRKTIVSKIEGLARDPFGAANVKQLVGQPGYRLRVGGWRVIYDVDSGRVVVRVLRIAPRGGAYR